MKRTIISVLIILVLAQSLCLAEKKLSYDVFPYVLYSSTSGTILGVAGLAKNALQRGESLGLICDVTGNGGNDVILSASFPDKEERLHTLFPAALDMELWVGRWMAERFYGIGNDTPATNYTYYNNNYGILKLILSKALSSDLVAEAGINYYANDISAISQGSNPLDPSLVDRSRSYLFGAAALKMDRTDNYLSPHKGESAYFTVDVASGWLRGQIDLEKFATPFHPDQVLAGRLLLVELAGSAVPLYEYATLGGRDTLRGYSFYRFRGGAFALANLEYRFPIVGQFSGVAFIDSGKVFSNLTKLDLASWPGDYGFGLRYLLGSMVLRLDYGIGQEERNLYFYYNHVF